MNRRNLGACGVLVIAYLAFLLIVWSALRVSSAAVIIPAAPAIVAVGQPAAMGTDRSEPDLTAAPATRPPAPSSDPPAVDRTPPVPKPSARPPATPPPASFALRGVATWFMAPVGTAAAGPALRRALGPLWRGRTVLVSAGERFLVVRLTDSCACVVAGDVRLIDLGRSDLRVAGLGRARPDPRDGVLVSERNPFPKVPAPDILLSMAIAAAGFHFAGWDPWAGATVALLLWVAGLGGVLVVAGVLLLVDWFVEHRR